MSMGIIESGEYNKVAGLGGGTTGTVIDQTFPDYTFIEDNADQIIGSITLTKGKWIVVGQVTAPNVELLRSFAITTGSAVFQTVAYQFIGGGNGSNLTRILNVTSDSLTVNLTGYCAGVVETWGNLRLTAIKVSD